MLILILINLSSKHSSYLEVEKLELTGVHRLILEALNGVIPFDYPKTLKKFEKVLGPKLEGNLDLFKEGYCLALLGTLLNYKALIILKKVLPSARS